MCFDSSRFTFASDYAPGSLRVKCIRTVIIISALMSPSTNTMPPRHTHTTSLPVSHTPQSVKHTGKSKRAALMLTLSELRARSTTQGAKFALNFNLFLNQINAPFKSFYCILEDNGVLWKAFTTQHVYAHL